MHFSRTSKAPPRIAHYVNVCYDIGHKAILFFAHMRREAESSPQPISGVQEQELDTVEQSLASFLRMHDKDFSQQIAKVRIERGHWDEPDVTLSWESSDAIERNIHALLAERDHEHPQVQLVFEVNAWKDTVTELQGEPVSIRRWQNAETGRLPVPLTRKVLGNAINQAYKVVTAWNDHDLVHEHKLPATPVSMTSTG